MRLFAGSFLLSLLAMILIDYVLGPRAEALNAWSVIERLLGRTPSAGTSWVAGRFGAWGEFGAVLAANALIGTVIAVAFRAVMKVLK